MFSSVVPACWASTHAGYPAPTTLASPPRPRSLPCSKNAVSTNATSPATSTSNTPGNGKRSMAESSSPNCANWVLPATGTVLPSPWTTSATKASSAYSSTSTTKALSIAASAWSTGTPKHSPPSATRRSSTKRATENSIISDIILIPRFPITPRIPESRKTKKASTSLLPPPAPKPSSAILPYASIPKTPATPPSKATAW